MRKLFLFLCAALMSVGMFATTVVTITDSDFPAWGKSCTKDGVTVSAAGFIDGSMGNIMDGGSFSTTLGNFTQIEVTAADVYMLSGEGWSGDDEHKTWTGNASSVSFSGDIMGNGQGVTLKFTIEEPATVAVTGVTLNQNEAQMTVGGETLTLTATVNPNNATDQSVSWSTSDGDVATVDNGVVTAVAAGNATITVTTTDGSFTATCAVTVTAPEPQPQPTTVTWGATEFSSFGVDYLHDSRTVKGITVTVNEANQNFINVTEYGTTFNATIDNAFTFSTELGNITKIECTTLYTKGTLGDGWTIGANSATWEGNTNTLNFGNAGSMLVVSNIIFTIGGASTPEPEPEPEPVTTYTVTFTDINSNVKVVENITLPHTFSCDYTNGNGELDLIIQEFYNEPGGHCATNGWPWGGNDNEVVVGHDGNNHFVTINAPFIGTSFMSGYYDGINDGNFYYTFHITIAAAEPEPQPAEDVNITPNADPENPTVYYSTFFDSANKYALPAGVEAYVATLDGANLKLSKIADAGQTIPADNAVILKSTVTPFTLTPSEAEAVPVNAINSLEGTDDEMDTPANCYVLAGNNGVGFYHYTASMLNPHKAYVIYSASGQAPSRMPFIFDQATGVENVQGDNVQSTKVIENGQLIIIKNGVKYNAQGQVVR